MGFKMLRLSWECLSLVGHGFFDMFYCCVAPIVDKPL